MIDLLAIGDIGIDTYYMLDPNDATKKCKHDDCELCLELSEKISVEDIYKTIGGNACNAAITSSRLGLETAILSEVGNDEDGRKLLLELEKEDINIRNVKRSGRTNQSVALVYNGRRTLLVHHEKRKYNFKNIPASRWIYFTSLACHNNSLIKDIIDFAEENNSKITFSPGTLQRKAGPGLYSELLDVCDLLIMNKQEATDYTKCMADDTSKILDKLMELGPSRAVITDAEKGSWGSDGISRYHCPACPAKVVDNTGAGDAYSATLTAALALGKTLPEGMRLGSANAAAVVENIGPSQGLQTLPKLLRSMENCPNCKELR